LAPGDSTVVELTFSTKAYKTAVTKNATIFSNDLTNGQAKIYVSAKVDPIPDTTITLRWEPSHINFTQKQKSYDVVINNTGESKIDLSTIGDKPDNLSISLDKTVLEPGSSANVKIEWVGEFEKENIERSATFVAGGVTDTRFTIPFVVVGTDPTPKAEHAANKAATVKKASEKQPEQQKPKVVKHLKGDNGG